MQGRNRLLTGLARKYEMGKRILFWEIRCHFMMKVLFVDINFSGLPGISGRFFMRRI